MYACMYVCMYACMYVCTHVYIHIHVRFLRKAGSILAGEIDITGLIRVI